RDAPTHRCKDGRHHRARVPTRSTKLSQFCHGGTPVCAQAARAALARVPLRRLGTARPLFSVSGRLSGSTRVSPLVCPTAVRRRYGKVGNSACGQHTSKRFNAQMRASLCLAALVSPERDRARLPKSPSLAPQEPACPQKRRETWKQSKERARALARRGLSSR